LNDDMVGGTCRMHMVSEIEQKFVWKTSTGQCRNTSAGNLWNDL